MWLPVEQLPKEIDCVFTASGVFEKSGEGLIIVETQEHKVCLLAWKAFLLYTH